MDTMLCECDLDASCSYHVEQNDAMTWPAVLGLKPTPQDAWDAYEGGWKSKYFEGWN